MDIQKSASTTIARSSSLFARAVNIDDLRRLARRRLPKAVFDYLDGGAEGEVTLRENCRVFDDIDLSSTAGRCVSRVPIWPTKVLGFDLSFPLMLAPVGYSRLMHPIGEVGAARVAGQSGIGYILSTISGHSLEKVRAATKGPLGISFI